jgi:hypothetical protein
MRQNNYAFLQIMSQVYLFFGGAIIAVGIPTWFIEIFRTPYYVNGSMGIIPFLPLIYIMVGGLGFMGAGQVLQAIREIAINTRMQNYLLTTLVERRSGNSNRANPSHNAFMPPKYNYPVPPDPTQF